MIPFLRSLADRILAAHGPDLREVAVVLPSRRAAIWFRRRLAEAAGQPLWSPEVHTFPTLAERITGSGPVDPIEASFILHEVQSAVLGPAHAWGLDRTLDLAPSVLSDMSEVDAHLVDHHSLYRDLTAFSEIEEWSFRLDPLSPQQQRHRHFWKDLGRIHEHFNRTLLERSLGTEGLLERTSVQLLLDGAPSLPTWKAVWVAGANALTAAQVQMLVHLQAKGLLRVVWDGDTSFVDDTRQAAGSGLRALIARFGAGELPLGNAWREHPRTVEVVKAPNATAQVHHLVNELVELTPEERERTAVVLPEEHLLPSLLAALPDALHPFNITMGLGLQALPVGALARALFTLHAQADPERGYRHAHVAQLLSHPFLRAAEGRDHRDPEIMLRSLRTAWVSHHMIDTILLELPETIARHAVATFSPVVQPAMDLPDRARHAVRWALASKGDDTLIGEQLHTWSLVLERLEHHLNAADTMVDAGTWARLHDRVLRQQRLDLVGEPLLGLQIMGFLETRALDHDRVYMLSCNEGALPPAASTNSFIPHDIRRSLGLPLPMHSDAVNAYHFHRALQRASSVTLLHHEGTGDGQAEPSRYILQWAHDLAPDGPTSWHAYACGPPPSAPFTATIGVQRTSELMRLLHQLLVRGLSPSAMAAFVQCPLDFLHVHVLGCKPLSAPGPRIPLDIMGTAVHRIYERIYRPFVGRTLSLDAFDLEHHEVRDLLSDQFRTLEPGMDLGSGEPLIQLEMASKAIHRDLQHERRALVRSGEVVVLDVERQLEHVVFIDGRKVTIKGRADRLEHREGVVQVIDLKTGHVQPNKLELMTGETMVPDPERTMALQLAIYAWLVLQNDHGVPNVQARIISLRDPGSSPMAHLRIRGRNGLDRESMPLVDELLNGIVRDMLTSQVPFVHRHKASYCTCCVA